MAEDKRKFSRIEFDAEVHIANATGSWHSHLIDISLQGMLISRPDNWNGKASEHFVAEVTLENSDIHIRMETSVAHIEDDHVGLKCENIDLDSITHLRKLVELNLGDPELVNRELAALGQAHNS